VADRRTGGNLPAPAGRREKLALVAPARAAKPAAAAERKGAEFSPAIGSIVGSSFWPREARIRLQSLGQNDSHGAGETVKMVSEVLNSYRLTLDYLRRLVADVPDADLTRQPGGVANHPAWVIGHLVFSCQALGGELGLAAWLPTEGCIPHFAFWHAGFMTVH
jgi:DinB superfamily